MQVTWHLFMESAVPGMPMHDATDEGTQLSGHGLLFGYIGMVTASGMIPVWIEKGIDMSISMSVHVGFHTG